MYLTLPISFLLLAATTAGYTLPNQSGKYNVTLTIGTLTDYTRNDPSVATPTPRTLVLSVFQPTECKSTVDAPYMPNKTAEFQGPYLQQEFGIPVDLSPIFLAARLPVCPSEPKTCSTPDHDRMLLFSGGWNIPRLYYSALASAIASEGFTVITIDHPGDTNIITYPDGHAVVGLNASDPTGEEFAVYTHRRAADVSFIIDQLSNATVVAELFPQREARKLELSKIGMLGHSLGGATAVQVAGQDLRVRAAINIDGAFWGSVPSSGISKPIMYMISEQLYNVPHPTLDTLWPQLKGPKLLLEIVNSMHMGLTDAPVLLQAAGQDTAAFANILGTIAPAEMVRIVVAYTSAWMKGAFAGRVGGSLLDGKESKRFAEAKTLMKANF